MPHVELLWTALDLYDLKVHYIANLQCVYYYMKETLYKICGVKYKGTSSIWLKAIPNVEVLFEVLTWYAWIRELQQVPHLLSDLDLFLIPVHLVVAMWIISVKIWEIRM